MTYLRTIGIAIFAFAVVANTQLFGQNQIEETSDVMANGDVAKIFKNFPIELPVTDNDFGLVSGIASVSINTNASHGTLEVQNNFKIKYTPNLNYVGRDKFIYQVCANDGGCDTASVIIEVINYNFIPKLKNDTIEAIYQQTIGLSYSILSNDLFLFETPITVEISSQLTNGEAIINEDNTLSVNFNYEFIGVDSLSYSVCDNNNDCDTALVVFEVKKPINGTELIIPNGFSPNGDGINDNFFIVQLEDDKSLSITILNEWGETVYVNTSYHNDWNGTANNGVYKGNLLPNGVYYYILNYNNGTNRITGNIYLNH